MQNPLVSCQGTSCNGAHIMSKEFLMRAISVVQGRQITHQFTDCIVVGVLSCLVSQLGLYRYQDTSPKGLSIYDLPMAFSISTSAAKTFSSCCLRPTICKLTGALVYLAGSYISWTNLSSAFFGS